VRVSPLFFQLLNYRCGADPQHPCRVAHPTAVEAQLAHLLFDLRRAALVGGIEQERVVRTVRIVAAVVLFAGVSLAALDYLLTLTARTPYRNESHRLPCHEKESLWQILSMQVQI
jgi:hypothetical protein